MNDARLKLYNPWHVRIGKYGRAFILKPDNYILYIIYVIRGWKKFNEIWMSKPSKNQRIYEMRDK